MTTFEVMGFKTQEGSEVNTDTQTQGLGSKPPLVVIYTTDDMAEVDQILAGGGYVDSNNVFWVAEGYRVAGADPDVVRAAAEPVDAPPVRKADFVPDNSSATIDDSGRVRTDAQKEPLTQADVEIIAQEEAEIPRKRNIVDHEGGL